MNDGIKCETHCFIRYCNLIGNIIRNIYKTRFLINVNKSYLVQEHFKINHIWFRNILKCSWIFFHLLYWSSAFKSDQELSVQKLHPLRMQIAQARIVPNVGCNSSLTPMSPGSDSRFKHSVWTDCMCSVKCNYKSGRHSALQITCIFIL